MIRNTWSNPIEAMVQRSLVKLERTYRQYVYNVFEAILKRTPVRTGRFLANWNVTVDSPDYSYSQITDVGRALSQLDKVFTLPGTRNFIIANGLPYGELLEYAGWSRQAPQGMIRITMAESDLHLRRAIQGG